MNIARTTPVGRGKALHASGTIQLDTLRTACELVGGESKLASHVHAGAAELARWLKGEERLPTRVFVHCVDIVLLHERHLGTFMR